MVKPPADASYHDWRTYLSSFGQDHVLHFWSDLKTEQQERLLQQLAAIDIEMLSRVHREAVEKPSWQAHRIGSAAIRPISSTFEDWEQEQSAAREGERALAAGQVAVLMVAGGQGTRLGYEGPKGTYAIGPVTGKSLFQIHAEKIVALSRRWKCAIPFIVMTSSENDEATRRFFAEHENFGLEEGQVEFFQQGTMPVVDGTSGKLLLSNRGEIAVSPDGHGGVLRALAQHGHISSLLARGFQHLFYFQVDNPLVKVADPAFLGYHIVAEADIATKVVAKTKPDEKLGMAAEIDGVPQIIEYSDLPTELAEKRDSNGKLTLWGGNTAIHVFRLAFLERLTTGSLRLPFHRAMKPAPHVDVHGQWIVPKEPNGCKFEMFIFDAIPLAKKAIFLETRRSEEFEPLKNAEGANSPETVRKALSQLFALWLVQTGITVPLDEEGRPRDAIEISPLFALDAEELRDKISTETPLSGPIYLS